MNAQEHDALAAAALALLAKRDHVADLAIAQVRTDIVPSSKSRIFQFVAASKRTPNEPKHVIVLDEKGTLVDLAALRKRENAALLVDPPPKINWAALRKLGSADALVTISPTENDLTLPEGDTFGPETIRVVVPRSTPAQKVDVYFLADTTGSMQMTLAAVQASSGAILTALAALGLDFAFGVGNYTDFPSAGSAFTHQLSPTSVAADVQAAIAAWTLDGGGDIPEGQLFALDRIARDAGGMIGWRFNAKHIIVWFGDAPGHEPVCRSITGLDHDITAGSVIGDLAAADITVVAISTTSGPGLDADPAAGATDYLALDPACRPAGFPGQASLITAATGGAHLTDVDPTAIANVIIGALTDAALTINRVELDPSGPAVDFISTITPGTGFGPLSGTEDHDLAFQVTFEGAKPCSFDGPQVFEGVIAVKVDGNVVGVQKHIRVTVPQCVLRIEIESPPTATTAFRDFNAVQQINVGALSTDDQLIRFSHAGDPSIAANWTWQNAGRPGGMPGTRLAGTPFAIDFFQEFAGLRHDEVHFFVRGADGHLYEIVWNGTAFSPWADRGQPYWLATLADSPTVAQVSLSGRFEEGSIIPGVPSDETTLSRPALFAYAWGTDGGLFHFGQVWSAHGHPPNAADVGSLPGAPVQMAGNSLCYVYVVGNDNQLYASHSTDSSANGWNWRALGQPDANTGIGVVWFRRPGVIWYVHDQRSRLYTFVTGTDGQLWVHVWHGALGPADAGAWDPRGRPGPNIAIGSAASVVTCPHNGVQQLYAFVRGSDGNLYAHFWDAAASVWRWQPLGQPQGVQLRGDPSATVCKHPGADPLYVFVRGNDSFLHMCHVDSGITTPTWVLLDH
jgi:hypothetical protein